MAQQTTGRISFLTVCLTWARVPVSMFSTWGTALHAGVLGRCMSCIALCC